MTITAPQSQDSRRRIVERPRLTRLLDDSRASVKMLVAPAGYGKTTLARQWLATKSGPALWVTVTPAAADVALLFSELCRGLGGVAPGKDERLRERLAVTADPEAEWSVLAEMLIEDIGSLEAQPLLVIDDYHQLTSSETAQAVLGQIAEAGVCATLVVSRTRPTWVSTRQILYGDVLELGQNELAMTNEEAEAAFAGGRVGPGLVHLTQGWPAVLALAALSPEASFPESGDVLPEALHAYFAEELYQCLDPDVQRGLTRIALAEIDDVETAREFFDDPEKGLDQAVSVGWIARPTRSIIELHPLLRAFLRRRLERINVDEFRSDSQRTATLLIERDRWDEAARLIEDQGLLEAFVPLLEASLESLLSQGRLATVREWVAVCTAGGIDAAIVRLATAELAFREGRFFEAELVASSITEVPASDQLRFKALLLAGRAAHIASREREALAFFRAARREATVGEDDEHAALGELAAATELELPEAEELLNEISEGDPGSVEQRVVLAARGLIFDIRFCRPPRLNVGRRVHQLLPSVKDPVVRSSFRNAFAYILAQSGASSEARAVLAEQRQDVETYRLTFVEGYADLLEALIQAVEGDFDGAGAALDRVEAIGRASGDWFLVAGALAQRGRVLISRGMFDAAIACTVQDLGLVPQSSQAEVTATYALALSCAGRVIDAEATAMAARRSSRSGYVAILSACVDAVIATTQGRPNAFVTASEALALSRQISAVEGILAAIRGCPELGALLIQVPETRRELMPVLTLGNEQGRYLGLTNEAAMNSGGWDSLSKREKEVLRLVARGMSNGEIAAELFIADATVKVHVHHILEKLGVKSRTAAAMRIPPEARAMQPPPPRGEESNRG